MEGHGIRSFGALQNVTKGGGVAGVLYATPQQPKGTLGEMRVAVVTTVAADIFYIMNDGVNGNKLIKLGTTVANALSTFKFTFRATCTYDIAVFNSYAPVTIVDLDVEEIDTAVGF